MVSYDSVVLLLDAIRSLQLAEDWRKVRWGAPENRTLLPPEVAGWFCFADQEDASEGQRTLKPIGSVVAELRAFIKSSALKESEREVLCAFYGLDRFPMSIKSEDSLVGLFANAHGKPWKRARVQILKSEALTALAAQLPERRAEPLRVDPTLWPLSEPWFCSLSPEIQKSRLDAAYSPAVLHCCAAGPTTPQSIKRGLKLGKWFEAARHQVEQRHSDSDPLPGRSWNPVRTIAAIFLWLACAQEGRDDEVVRPTHKAHGRLFGELVTADEVADLARLLTSQPDEIDYDACAIEIRSLRDDLAPLFADALLFHANQSGDPRAVVTALEAAIQVGTLREDMRVLNWASTLQTLAPTSEGALRSYGQAAITAGGNQHFDVAQSLLYDGIDNVEQTLWSTHQNPASEKLEWQHEHRLSLLGQMRRQEVHKLLLGNAPDTESIRSTLVNDLEAVQGYSEARGGGVDHQIRLSHHIRLCCRAAEISLVEAQHLMNATGRNQATRRLLQEVMRYITRAEELVGRLQPGSKHVRNQRIGVSKVRIWATSLEGDPESLADNLRMLHDLGWSAWRSAPTVLAVLAENENHRRSPGISEPVRRTIRDALELQPSLAWAGNSGVQDRIWTTRL